MGVALVMASYLEDAEVHLPPVSIRLTASTLLTGDDIRIAGKTVLAVCREIFDSGQVGRVATVDFISILACWGMENIIFGQHTTFAAR